jgi:hypothetical protein
VIIKLNKVLKLTLNFHQNMERQTYRWTHTKFYCDRIVNWGPLLLAVRSMILFSMRSLNSFFNLPNSSSRTMALGFTQPLTETSTTKYFLGVERGRLSRKCVIIDISQLYRPALPVRGINQIPLFQKHVKSELKPHLSSVCIEKLVNCSQGFVMIDNVEL